MPVLKTPLVTGEVELSGTDKYWKLILPLDKQIDYHGRKIKFDRNYLQSLVAGFNDKVMDQVAFQLANDDNEHDTEEDKRTGRNFDPQRYRGEIDAVEIRDNRTDGLNGLWGRLSPTEAGQKLIKDNSKLSVSASIRENYKHNGKTYPAVFRHVLGTLDPFVKGMGPWEKAEVSLANDEDKDEEVIDLTTPNDKNADGKIEIDKARFEELEALEKQIAEEDAEFDAFVEEALKDNAEPVAVGLSNTETNDDPRIVQLSNEVADAKFEREADQWRREGVPNPLIELARPVLSSGYSMDVQLSSGSKVDPKSIIREMLNEAKGVIDLTAQNTHSQSQEERELEDKNKEEAADYFVNFF